ncbi:MAG: (2Fe-2S)-binding protein [Gemmatimonadales bacterium]|nr:(2Fe-2S)-binding protein [Gemmatimonadales bacterium]
MSDTHDHADGVPEQRRGVSRRGFLSSVGTGALSAAAASRAAAEAPPRTPVLQADELVKVALHVNSRRHEVLVEPRWSLAYVLRERLGLTGTKVGCERGECGACTVLIDDVPRYACLTLAVEAAERHVTTLEGLMEGEDLGPTQQAFVEEDAFQCGYCTPGQIMAVDGLLRENPDPSLDEIRRGVSGNLCRCGTYAHIFRAARRAAELKRERGGAS